MKLTLSKDVEVTWNGARTLYEAGVVHDVASGDVFNRLRALDPDAVAPSAASEPAVEVVEPVISEPAESEPAVVTSEALPSEPSIAEPSPETTAAAVTPDVVVPFRPVSVDETSTAAKSKSARKKQSSRKKAK